MGRTGKGGAPLVADRRYRAASGGSGGGSAGGTGGGAKRPAPRKPAPRRPRRRGLFGLLAGIVAFFWRLVWGVVWRSTAVIALILALTVGYFYAQLPPVSQLTDGRARGSVTLTDREGQVFAWRGETFGHIDADSVSRHLRNAVIATEDKRFYSHLGISPRGIAGAVRINLSEGRSALSGNGGSTISQQVAKLLCLGVPFDPSQWASEAAYEEDCRKGSVWRKLKEMPYAFALEARYSKAEILTIYLNRAYLGAGARGFEAAMQRYFGKSAREASAAEGAMLAGLLRAPSRFAPTNNLQRSRDRAAVVITLMQEQGYLTAAEAAEARANPARLSPAAETKSGGYFADWVMDSVPSFLSKTTTEDVTIRTTLDQRLQRAAETAVAEVFKTKVREGSKAETAVIVMSADGAVRAMVGGRAAQLPGAFNRATMAKRQTGSSFKPFVYAAALDQGFSAADYVEDAPLTINIPGSGPWSPQNYTRDYRGVVTVSDALKWSLNTAAVRISEAAGRENVRRVATAFGIDSDLAAGPALALGASESTLIEMSGAYAGILNGGTAVRPYGLVELRLRGQNDVLMGQEGGFGERVISERAARELTWMMTEVITGGTGTRARLPGREAAGKTGTTSAARDAWFIGYTADYVAGVWMGYDDNTPLAGVTGGGLPAEIWKEVMVRVHDGLPARPLPMDRPEWRRPPDPARASGAPVPVDVGQTGNQPGGWPPETPPQPYDVAPRQPDLAEQILREVLGIFGGQY
ncbi:MAG: transglycosylase domain-containing protein [Gemmobacter sp.]